MDENKRVFKGPLAKTDVINPDGTIFAKDAFKDCDGTTVPVSWYDRIIGNATLESKDDGVYMQCTLIKDIPDADLISKLLSDGLIVVDISSGPLREISLIPNPKVKRKP